MGSNPATVLAIVALPILTLVRWISSKFTEVKTMSEKVRKYSGLPSTVMSQNNTAVRLVGYFLETAWAIGASIVAAMVISPSTL